MANRYFIALLPPEDVQQAAHQVKQQFSDRYNSRKAFNSPPHVTLQPPFELTDQQLAHLEVFLRGFAAEHYPVPMQLSGFAAFPPRVIYIHVLPTPELMQLQQELMASLERELGIGEPVSRQRAFKPHLTVAFRDLTPANFRAGWAEFQDQPFEYPFVVPFLSLLIHRESRWQLAQEFGFRNN